MGLPKLEQTQTFIKTKLPSGKTIGITGWRIKEEKELLFALEVLENPGDEKLDLIIDMLKQCSDDKSKFDSVSESDIIKIAIEVRKLSKGDTIEYNYTCPHCKHNFFDEVSLIKELVMRPFDISPLIVNDKLTVTFKDLDWKTSKKIFMAYEGTTKFNYKLMMHSIDSITYDGTSYTEFTPEETEEFFDIFKSKDKETLNDGFIARLSSCTLERKVKCIKCKKEININYGDLLSFLVF